MWTATGKSTTIIISTPTGFQKIPLSVYLSNDFNINEVQATGLYEPENVSEAEHGRNYEDDDDDELD